MQLVCPSCIYCNNVEVIDVPEFAYQLYVTGTPVHEAFDFMSPAEREVIISGTHPNCWEELFGSLEEEEK